MIDCPGLLSAYALTGNDVFKDKAEDLGNRLLPIFDTNTGVPRNVVNLRTGNTTNWNWVPGQASILSEIGTLQLEFEYLSAITDNPTYAYKVKRSADYVQSVRSASTHSKSF